MLIGSFCQGKTKSGQTCSRRTEALCSGFADHLAPEGSTMTHLKIAAFHDRKTLLLRTSMLLRV